MKNIIVFMLVCSSFLSKASVGAVVDSAAKEVKEAVSFVDTSSTFKTVYMDVRAGIIALASNLKVGAEHVYKVMVVQQVAKAVTFLLLLILSFIFAKLCYNEWGKIEPDKNNYETGVKEVRPVVFSVVFGLAGFVMFFVGIMNFDVIITGFINPEYGAIADLIKFVNSAR